ncbi:MAG TPA: VanZ family protein [Steroidobacteraceae bacterium]|nr:VanZ family protein [Steroidobacteraceae bacterium]
MSHAVEPAAGAPPDHRATARWIALGVALLIVWGSLYPLQFIAPTAGQLRHRLASVAAHVLSRIDLIANFLLYLPFGAACRLSLGGTGTARRTIVATLIGSTLSLVMELAQLLTPHRVTSVFDWSVNTTGAACGAIVMALYLRIGRRWRLAGLRHPRPALVPACLLAIWFIGEFTPYLPTHRALPLGRMFAGFRGRQPFAVAQWCLDLTRWWIIAECVRQIWRRPWSLLCFAALIGLTALEQAWIGSDRRSVAQWLSWCIVPVMLLLSLDWPARARAWCTIAGCLAVLVTANVWPLPAAARIGVFHWIPFSGTLLSTRDYRPLLESLFFSGALLWSLTLALRRPATAFLLTLGSSVAVEIAHLLTPPHRAEITDPLLVVALLIAFAAARRYQSYAYGDDAGAVRPPRDRR